MENIKIDKKNMCVDKNTEFGKELAEFNKRAAAMSDPRDRAFMQKLSAYAEAALVVEGICPADEAKVKIDELVKSMNISLDAVK